MNKQNLIILALVFGIGYSAQAQKINEKDLMGSWHMVIDIDNAMKVNSVFISKRANSVALWMG